MQSEQQIEQEKRDFVEFLVGTLRWPRLGAEAAIKHKAHAWRIWLHRATLSIPTPPALEGDSQKDANHG